VGRRKSDYDAFFAEMRMVVIPNTDISKVEFEMRPCAACGTLFKCSKKSKQQFHNEFCKDEGPTQRTRFPARSIIRKPEHAAKRLRF